ncbi:ABC transporter ATP-binding protein [Azotobacter bryophylli]|uniref:ABC transporter ATP-binding protein n=1 Tax=Azotobacter bryophylli TaxID=1986537 RepID=A0ABV7AXB4_9GAMM
MNPKPKKTATRRKPKPLILPGQPVPFLWRYLRLRPWHFGFMFLLIFSASSCAVAVQYGMKLLVDALASNDRQHADVWTPLALFLTLIVAENGLWRMSGWLGCRTVVSSCVDIRVELFRYLTGHPMRYFNEHFAGALGNRITATGMAAGNLYGGFAWKIMPPLVDFFGAVVVLFTVDWRMAVSLIVAVLLVAILITAYGIRGRTKHQRYAAQAAQVGGELVDAVSNVWTIKAFSARDRESDRLAQRIGREARAHRGSWMYMEKTRVLHDVCLSLMAAGMLVWAILLWRAGSVTAGDVVLVSTLTFRILNGSRDLALALVDAVQQLGAIADTLRVIVRPHDLKDTHLPLPEVDGTIDLIDVSYSYPDGRQVFSHLNLHIPAGQKVGLVGPSGAGKSTLVQLIQRLDDVREGCILIDGHDIRQVSVDSLRQMIAVVPQETALFARSIRENIRYGRPDANNREVEEAARLAYCDSFIRELRYGYDTHVGERGARLSGGQRQRLGIARAFLKDSPILILDEATSALDTRSEAEIQVALADLVRGRTVLAVAHRLSTVANFDRILVLQGGRIVEDGPPAELLKRDGLYAALWKMQAHGFMHDPELPPEVH